MLGADCEDASAHCTEALSAECLAEELREARGIVGWSRLAALRRGGFLVPLARALASREAFARHLGDMAVLGAGAWNLVRDAQVNMQESGEGFARRHRASSGSGSGSGAPLKLPSAAAILERYEREVEWVAGFLRALPEPWRSELLQRRLLWKELTHMEPLPYNDHGARGDAAVAAANAVAQRLIGGLGVRILRIAKYSRWANESARVSQAAAFRRKFLAKRAAAAAAGEPGKPLNNMTFLHALTRDGTHPAGVPLRWMRRETLGELVAMAERTPREQRSLGGGVASSAQGRACGEGPVA